MPQISQIAATYASQIFWLLLTFGFVFFVIGRGIVPKVQATVDQRDGRIADDLEQAKAAFARADEIEADYRTQLQDSRSAAQQQAAEAKAKAAKATEKQLATADGKIAGKIAEAEERIAAASKAAMGEIETVAADLAQDIVSRVAGTTVAPDAARDAVKAVLAHG
ncbi:MAG: ATPase [Sphingobium sp.]|jgi:F-type H+-transporting ATPase subunit b|nr:MAG: ATPase [Sphingobium sp.]